jgi:uncharacterized protein YpuA (DUF1002 family)
MTTDEIVEEKDLEIVRLKSQVNDLKRELQKSKDDKIFIRDLVQQLKDKYDIDLYKM